MSGTTPAGYYDYFFKFPATTAGLALALTGIPALQAVGIIAAGDIPANMLGDPRDVNGNIVSNSPAFVGRKGSAAGSYTDLSGNIITIPAKGDPAYWYVESFGYNRRWRSRASSCLWA